MREYLTHHNGLRALGITVKGRHARRLERGAPRIGLFEHREGGGGKGGGDVAPVMVVVVGRVMVARLEAARVEAVMVVVGWWRW